MGQVVRLIRLGGVPPIMDTLKWLFDPSHESDESVVRGMIQQRILEALSRKEVMP